jgi:hypothetical protein
MCKEVTVAYLKYSPKIGLKGLRKPRKAAVMLAALPAEIQSGFVLNIKQTPQLHS